VNGLPLVVIELKNPADAGATLEKAYNQLTTYLSDIPALFTCNALQVISDGTSARLGALGAPLPWYRAWRSVDGMLRDPYPLALETLVRGALAPERLLNLVRHYTVFETARDDVVKKVAAYHQYFAVERAVQRTVAAVQGDRRAGVVWHTQGSGKSLSMLFYAGRIIAHPAMENPTIIVLTDRNDLDDQLYGVFAAGSELLRQAPVQAENRDDLKRRLRVASGGVVFTTIQKFMPEGERASYPQLSDRRNIVFIADEAHRSQYGFGGRMTNAGMQYGFAKYVRDALPNASFIGFTGTPIETTDANTRQVFGDYIDVYDIQRAVEDRATVPIYYEARMARINLRDEARPTIDPEFEEVTEAEEEETRERLKTRWAALEAMVGTPGRLAQVAADIVVHFEERQKTLVGKAMIVAMSRRIAVALYDEIVALRPTWHDERDEGGVIKVVMTGSASDPSTYQPHVRNKQRRRELAERFKDPLDPLKLVIVRDMWLTGFDAPSLNTMYVDKPMKGHGLMQAIARVNRVFRDKPGGLVVDYLGIGADLQKAVEAYTQEGGEGIPAEDLERIVQLMQTKYDVIRAMFHGFPYDRYITGTAAERLALLPAAMEHILAQADGKRRYLEGVTQLSQAFAMAVPAEEALAIRDDVAFFQAVRAQFVKHTPREGGQALETTEAAVKQIVSEAVASEGVIDIFGAAGLSRPDVSILSDEFLEDVRRLPQKNLALELLRKLLTDSIMAREKRNLVQARQFSDMLENTIRRYQNRTIDSAEVIAELIGIAQEIREQDARGEHLGLSEDEMAFYDALAENKSAVEVMGDTQLAVIATLLVEKVRQNVTIDWTVRQSARAKIRVLVKRILREYRYPPDLAESATNLILEQAELLAAEWAVAEA
jgi:type I restriction enzyme, R subunit